MIVGTLLLSVLFLTLLPQSVEAQTLPTLSVKIHRIMQLDEIDPGSEADWYYHVGVRIGTTWSWKSSPVYNEADDLAIDITHPFSVSSASIFIAITLCEDDSPWSGDDLADISSASGGGGNDYSSPISAGYYSGSYGGWYNLKTGLLTGDTTQIEGGWYKTSGAFDAGTGTNDATVWFNVWDNYNSPIANAGSDKTPYKGEQVNFDGSGSSASSGSSIVNYEWDFESDGTWDATGVIASHTYTSKATYTATLRITDSIGETATDTCIVTVRSRKPVVVFSYSPSNPVVTGTIQFTDMSTDSDGTIVSWSWDFGDGGTSNQKTPTHKYSSTGTYTVKLTVTDDDGEFNTKEETISISSSSMGEQFASSPLLWGLVIAIVLIIVGVIIWGIVWRKRRVPKEPPTQPPS